MRLGPIALDKDKTITNCNRVSFPKLSQIFAEVDSISSTLLIILFNQHLL